MNHDEQTVLLTFAIFCTFHIFRKDDDYDKAIGTLLSIGASVLKVAGEKILEAYNSQQVNGILNHCFSKRWDGEQKIDFICVL